MKQQEFTWHTFDGYRLFAQNWLPYPEQTPQGVIAVVHGMGEHSSRYDEWAKRFAEQQFAVIAFDHRGHGRSEGKRGHIPSFESVLKDVDLLIEEAKKTAAGKPVFLYGHSLGGNVVLNYIIRRKPLIKGTIASSPWLKLAFEPSKFKMKLGEWIQQVFPRFSQATDLDARYISRIPAEVDAYKNDPLIHDHITARMFSEVHKAGLYALEHARKSTPPLLIQHGTGDKITLAAASELFAQYANATLKLWPDAYHELHHDYHNEEVFAFVLQWLKSQMETSEEPRAANR